jgi:hypothetical protein
MPSVTPYDLPLADLAATFAVVRYHRSRTGDDRFEFLPNIKVESIHFREGSVLPSAQFSYVLDDTDPATPTPYRFEQLWPITASGPFVVQPEDELLVYHLQPGAANPLVVFDGFAQIPQVDQGKGLSATFAAVGVHVRLWDTPVANPRYRDAYDSQTGPEAITALPVHFNPEDAPRGNCTPEGYDRNQGDPNARPLFVDPQAPYVHPWSLPGMIRFLFWENNPNETWVKNPVAYTGQDLDDYLESVVPKSDGAGTLNLADPTTYDTELIIVRSFDATGKAVVEAAVEQLNAYGFKLFMNTRPDPADPLAPINELIIFRVDGRDAVAPKEVFVPPHGSGPETHSLPHAIRISLARDRLSSFNEVFLQTGLEEVEVSVILAPGFTITGSDVSNIATFDASAIANATASIRKKYRYFVADEDGYGHWSTIASAWVEEDPLNLDGVFKANGSNGGTKYVARRRPGVSTLFSADDAGRPRRAELAVSRDYAGPAPAVWDRTGTWRSLGESGWRLLKDRLGIEIVAESPESWKLPKAKDDLQAAGDVVKVITSLAAPAGANTRFALRLTCVIRGDWDAEALAKRRLASPSRFATRRLIDAREHYKYQRVHKSSAFNGAARDRDHRDDSERAVGHAAALRLAHEAVAVAGSITVPWISHAYGVGDLIAGLSGRGAAFGELGGGASGEGPQFPAVVGFDWTCQLPQSTVLHLSDRRAEGAEADTGDGRSYRGRR